jgi:hypothetical protein
MFGMCRKAKKTRRTQDHTNEVWLCAQHVAEGIQKITKDTPSWMSFAVGMEGHTKHAEHKNTHLLVCFCVGRVLDNC